MGEAYIGVDVGTGSARAGVFDAAGRLLAKARKPIAVWREAGGVVEQSSQDIWRAATGAVREAVGACGLPRRDFAGIGFDATCSLVVVDPAGAPLAVGPSGEAERNVIVWMDHRATAEAERIDAQGHPVLRHVGGKISPEMQVPKLSWLARHMPATFARAGHFFDLTDYLTWRASDATQRSLCTLTCKWTYLAHERRWAGDFFESLGLQDLAADGFARIGSQVVAPGSPLGDGLNRAAADAMGLQAGIKVGAGLIDAHAGAHTWPMPIALRWALRAGMGLAVWWPLASLAASFWVYDLAGVMNGRWIARVTAPLNRAGRGWVNIHAGFDCTTRPLLSRFPAAQGQWKVLDIFDPSRTTEPSIVRAKRESTPTPAIPAPFDHLPLPDSTTPTVFLLLAAHEVRRADERRAFFAELFRVLEPGGTLLLAEHGRDPANLLAFGPGCLHFYPCGHWRRVAAAAGFVLREHRRHTPFIHVLTLEKPR